MAEIKWNPLYCGSASTNSLFFFFPSIPQQPPLLACWFFCDNITTKNKHRIEDDRTKYIWNPHYAFSRIVETWLDGTFNKFLAYGVCRSINECSGFINWWFFKWRRSGNISGRTFFSFSPPTERWKLKSLESLFISTCCASWKLVEHKNIYESPLMRCQKINFRFEFFSLSPKLDSNSSGTRSCF